MDNKLFVAEQRIRRTVENLEKNNMEAYYVEDEKELLDKIKGLVTIGELVSFGGSRTLFETGVINYLRSGDFELLDRYKENLTKEEVKEVFRKSFFADTYFTSSNAVTEEGELYNVDGNGNRVAAMIYGPDKVIVIVGINKVVVDKEEAIKRCRSISAPANAKRLNMNTPCIKLGHCINCNSKDRICNDYVIIRRQLNKGRIKVIIVGKELGY